MQPFEHLIDLPLADVTFSQDECSKCQDYRRLKRRELKTISDIKCYLMQPARDLDYYRGINFVEEVNWIIRERKRFSRRYYETVDDGHIAHQHNVDLADLKILTKELTKGKECVSFGFLEKVSRRACINGF